MPLDEDIIRDRQYYKTLNYEAVLASQLNRIAGFASTRDWASYESSVDALMYMLPMDMRKKALKYKQDNNIKRGYSDDEVQEYYKLWAYCNELLEKGDLIFKFGKGPSEFGTA